MLSDGVPETAFGLNRRGEVILNSMILWNDFLVVPSVFVQPDQEI